MSPRQDFYFLLSECGSHIFVFLPCFPFPTACGHWTLLWDFLHVVWSSLTTLSHHRGGHVTQAWSERPVQVRGSSIKIRSQPKKQSLLQDFFSRIVRKKALFLPAGIAGYKNDVRLELSWSSFIHVKRAYLRLKPTREGSRAEKWRRSVRNTMINLKPLDSARPEGSTVDFPIVWANWILFSLN